MDGCRREPAGETAPLPQECSQRAGKKKKRRSRYRTWAELLARLLVLPMRWQAASSRWMRLDVEVDPLRVEGDGPAHRRSASST